MDKWIEFLNNINKAKKELKFRTNEECFYRGHISNSHKLTPGIFRNIGPGRKSIPDDIWQAEYSMFYEFRSRAKEVHGNILSDWDILFYMQHHGCKTRLLDWTENFGVSLFFSLLGYDKSKSSPTIWLLNPYALNEYYHETRDLYSPEFLDLEDGTSYGDILVNDSDFGWDEPIAIYPIRYVERLKSQGGYFTIHGNNVKPIEEIIPLSKNIWRKIELPHSAVEEAYSFLELAGINIFTVFPDLDGLSKLLNNKYLPNI